MGKIALIDTETNWADQVMSVGAVIADEETFRVVDARYHIFPQECEVGGMYSGALYLNTPVSPVVCCRKDGMQELVRWLAAYDVQMIFAYNAAFDKKHLPELGQFAWYDIMRLAAYRQQNPMIPAGADCFSTGRLKRGYGVEPMLRLLSGNHGYRETHNALFDAMDELEIMRLMGRPVEDYIPL